MFHQNLIGTLRVPVVINLYFLTGSLTQNVYNGRFSYVNNELNVTS